MSTWGNPPKFSSSKPKKAKPVTPEQLAASGSEDGEQAAVFCWSASMYGQYPQLKWLHAIPNGGSRHVAEATKMVAAGLRKGVLDIFLPWSSLHYYQYLNEAPKILHGLYVEMKTEKRRKEKNGGLTEEQTNFIEYATNAGYYCALCYSWIEAKDVILKYLEGKL